VKHILSRLSVDHECDGRTDGQMDGQTVRQTKEPLAIARSNIVSRALEITQHTCVKMKHCSDTTYKITM